MPWTGPQFAERHNHSLTPEQAAHAARIANAILTRGASEGVSIATANKMVEHARGIMHRDAGGSTDPSSNGGITPTAQNQNPLMQGMIQRYSSMSPEQLQQAAAMMGGTPQGQIIQKVLQQKRVMSAQQPQAQQQTGRPQVAQAPQAAPAPTIQPQQQKRGGETQRRDAGGVMSGSEASPWWTRSEARNDTRGGANGFLAGTTPGRADAIKTTAPAGAYVLPADVVAGLGEGNSLAGAAAVQRMLETGPHGIPMPRAGQRDTIPRAPSQFGRAAGGSAPEQPRYGYVDAPRAWAGPELHRAAGGAGGRGQTPVALSHGEFVVSPDHVARFGGGDHTKGVKFFDRYVVEQRKKHIAKLKSLPGPVKTT